MGIYVRYSIRSQCIESGHSQLKWKRSATQEDWYPRFAETARVHLLKETVSFSDLKACPHKPVYVEDKTELIKVYQRTSHYIVHDKETTIAENDVYLQSFFTGDRYLSWFSICWIR